MARPLRVQYEGAMYHVINRGNYRRDVFDSVGAAKAFEAALAEVVTMFGWLLHAWVLMRNHFHLAVETPEPNLVEGMHWLQGTYATRYNRFRGEQGHLFQGRFKAPLLENDGILARVVDYIHLNPVRAGLVPVEQVHQFRWSSLAQLARASADRPVMTTRWMKALGLEAGKAGLSDYRQHLAARFALMDLDKETRELCRGWAIGTSGWRRALAKDHQALALNPGVAAEEIRELRVARWSQCLAEEMAARGYSEDDLLKATKGAVWKCSLARCIRDRSGAEFRWIADALSMGKADSVRSLLSRHYRNQQYSA